MGILLNLALLGLRLIYFFIKLFPIKNKITMISRQSDNITVDFKLLGDEIKKDDKYKYIFLTRKLKPGIFNKIKYIFHMFSQMYHIATSKVVILDSYCVVISVLKHKKDLLVIQMWHAMGSLKKFGKSVLDQDSSTSALGKKMTNQEKKELSRTMQMHSGYDYIFTSSDVCAPNFAEAFGYDVSVVKTMPLPIVDLLTDVSYVIDKRNEISDNYKKLSSKKNILYVPTFRETEDLEKIQELIDKVDYNKYNLIIKPHPLTKIINRDDRVVWDEKYSSTEMLIAADYVISDYSAIVFEAAILNKPLFFYTYDYEEYLVQRDFYIDFEEEMPGVISKDKNAILSAINAGNFDLERVKVFAEKYVNQTNETICKRIMAFVDINLKNR